MKQLKYNVTNVARRLTILLHNNVSSLCVCNKQRKFKNTRLNIKKRIY